MTELLPCPFCGGEATTDDVGSLKPIYSAGCDNNDCKVEASAFSTSSEAEAIAAWNTRPSGVEDAETVERAARAIAAASGSTWRTNEGRSEHAIEMLDLDAQNNHWRHKARAALSAIGKGGGEVALHREEGYRQGIEAAARLCDTYDEWCGGWGLDHNRNAAIEGAKECATAIRNLGGNHAPS